MRGGGGFSSGKTWNGVGGGLDGMEREKEAFVSCMQRISSDKQPWVRPITKEETAARAYSCSKGIFRQ